MQIGGRFSVMDYEFRVVVRKRTPSQIKSYQARHSQYTLITKKMESKHNFKPGQFYGVGLGDLLAFWDGSSPICHHPSRFRNCLPE